MASSTRASSLLLNNHKTNHFLFSLNSKKPSLVHPFPPISSLSFSLSLSSSQSRSTYTTITRVSTAPLEYAPPAPDSNNFQKEISRLKTLRLKLSASKNLKEKLKVLNSDSKVKHFLNTQGFERVLGSHGLGLNELFLVKCLVAAGQDHVLDMGFGFEEREGDGVSRSVKNALYVLVEMIEKWDVNIGGSGGREGFLKSQNGGVLEEEENEDLKKLLKILAEIEDFYDCIGGIIGYQIMVLELLAQSSLGMQTTNHSQQVHESMECQFLEIHPPTGCDLSQNTEYASQAALWGIEGLPDLGEIYPLGGSADRLGLVDPDTGECLPAAMLPYCGRTLLEGLIRDLQAREFLYFKLYGKQCITPVAIMTSSAKNNHEHITSLCERLGWFGRGRSSFQLFEQPLVPAVSAEDGQWLVRKPFVPVCKPGGHGVIWKLAYDKGIFQWFYDHGRKGATVRQVSNVVAATDLTLLALAGIGLHHGKKLGFASCKRNSGATEGINVLIEKKNLDGKWAYGLSCIEYTEFDKFGITSGPPSPDSLQAEFPANTNILYVDLPSAELVGSTRSERSLPGIVLNTKKSIVYTDYFGNWHSVPGGRLECTMQNIADNFLNTYSSRCYKGVEDKLDAFIVYNERRRVTSSAKKKRKNADMSLHQVEGNDKYVDSGPPFLIFLHPALGPLWEVTRQKFSGGSISKGSELQIEVAEFLWRNVQLEGSMIIAAENIMGSTRNDENGEPILQHGHRCGRCKLHNVKVLNDGIDWSSGDNVYWKHDVHRFEALKVILHGNAEFEADNVTIQGNHVFEVPDGYKLKITSGDPGLAVQLDPIPQNLMDSGSWLWKYNINGSHILLELIEL
ncbi:UTP--glucose-1-phosphate uridylyltransferase 3, chloroplastic-like isoform X2 [Durio zibethinus]|uniref:UTP--glucose-1-phosphate uridylyltransferase 3, chloroplastic-like isoform X2 n=1 Tax=Durio zibethinus TaxID=66656 RepID=A0A6P6AJJ1_DURZI|nr:UTP--glucose-1-phosphate uridylyltransferase 3, chloroplastic-like isoform X2 [Durio zibethinus]